MTLSRGFAQSSAETLRKIIQITLATRLRKIIQITLATRLRKMIQIPLQKVATRCLQNKTQLNRDRGRQRAGAKCVVRHAKGEEPHG